MVVVQSSPIYFIGESPHTLDAKNRVTIPARWRSDDENAREVFVVVPYPVDGVDCLLAMVPEDFHGVATKVEFSTDFSEEKKREFISEWYASGTEVAVDKQGRLLLPEEYCRLKNLGTDLVLVGAKKRIEIWQKAARTATRLRRQPMQSEIFRKVGG